jgi:hypothetical protein
MAVSGRLKAEARFLRHTMMSDNLFGNIPSELPEELIEVLSQSDKVRIERIVSRGHSSPDGLWYDQDLNERQDAAPTGFACVMG